MWNCSQCGTQNEDSANFCISCGASRPQTYAQTYSYAQIPPETAAPYGQGVIPPAPPKKSRWWIWLLVGLVVLAAVAAVCYFTVHLWTPATCTEPETCSICRKVRGPALGHDFSEATCTEPSACTRCGLKQGEALGHDFQPATCTEPEICTRCGEKRGEALGHHASGEPSCEEPSVCTRCGELLEAALGHDWAPATYDAPETCRRCGQERGEVKGYVGVLEGDWANETLSLYGQYTTIPFYLDTPVKKCMQMTFYFLLSNINGNASGTWGLYGRDLDGRWQQLTTFPVDQSAVDNYTVYNFSFEEYPSFDALGVLPLTGNYGNGSYNFIVTDVQVYVD